MTRIACPTCDGRRVVAVRVPFTRTAGDVTYPVKSGEFRERLYQCSTCGGRGTVSPLEAVFERTSREQLLISDAAGDQS